MEVPLIIVHEVSDAKLSSQLRQQWSLLDVNTATNYRIHYTSHTIVQLNKPCSLPKVLHGPCRARGLVQTKQFYQDSISWNSLFSFTIVNLFFKNNMENLICNVRKKTKGLFISREPSLLLISREPSLLLISREA